jgi:dihydroxyacetone kinase-like protein
MKQLSNAPDTMLAEALDGFALAHAGIVVLGDERKYVRRRTLKPGKVALVSGGGAGHGPLHLGFVGPGMLDAVCLGQVFTSPTPDQIVAAIQATDTGVGALLIVKNYEGDRMNFEMAVELAPSPVRTVVVNDDVAVECSTHSIGRRGIAGTLIVEKMLGAAAEQGRSLGELQALGQRVNERTRSMGVAVTSCTVPAVGTPTFTLAHAEMELGVGIHGEPGRHRVKWQPADAIAETLLDTIVADLQPRRGRDCLLLVNGLGGTPLIELYLMANAAVRQLRARGINVARMLTGNYVTALGMAGCSLTLTELDDETLALWGAPVQTAALNWGGV